MTKSDLNTLVISKLSELAVSYTAQAKYFVIDIKRYTCYHRVLLMVKYISESAIDITQVDLEMLTSLVYQYSDIDKAIVKKI
jgi:hypothetical protein